VASLGDVAAQFKTTLEKIDQLAAALRIAEDLVQELPDHQLKFDLDTEHHIAAVHLFGPKDFLAADMTGEADDTTAWIALHRQADIRVPTGVTLYIDRDTRTEFPAKAALPLKVLRDLLHEFMRTGERPICVDWQQTNI